MKVDSWTQSLVNNGIDGMADDCENRLLYLQGCEDSYNEMTLCSGFFNPSGDTLEPTISMNSILP